MNIALDIIKKRALPGVLIIGVGNRLLYANREAIDMLPALHDCTRNDVMTPTSIPVAITDLCDRLNSTCHTDTPHQACEIVDPEVGLPCSLRAFYVGAIDEGEQARHIMVLVERIIEKREVDYTRVKGDYGLTKRETDVLRHICGGLTNREIAEKMFISEYTVKDHIKKIMKSMGTSSRSEIIATIK
jgi:DNA-binding CsgD family transcriptional regulator